MRTVRLSYNESPFGVSRRAQEALAALAADASRYAYEEVAALASLIAAHEGVKPENVFVSEGSAEILKLVALLQSEPARDVVTSRPTFTMLPQYASRRGATVTWVDVNEQFGHDFPALAAAVSPATNVVYVCNPNNPTGALAERAELRSFIQQVSASSLVVVDEAYIEYAPAPEQETVIDLAGSSANVLVTRSFSKVYGLAGLRVGYGIGHAALIRQLESMRFSVPNQAGVAAARASHGDTVFRSEVRAKNRESIRYTAALFDELKLRHAPTVANFMMFDTRRQSDELVEFARERGVLVAPIYEPLTTWIRVSMGRIEDMQEFGRVLRAFVDHA
jgi:histidinol-phosphate aminotransferase